jgi:FkbM family methyltransferase
MRKFLNSLLLPFGYELQRIDLFSRILDEMFASKAGVRFIQAGANDGVRFDDLYVKVTRNKCTGLVVEPLPDVYEFLRANYERYPKIVPVNAAVHASLPSVELYRVRPSAIPSLPEWVYGIASFNRDHLVKHRIPDQQIESQRVVCKPLMAILNEYGFLDGNMLQIDTEGYDAEVVRMIDFAVFRPRLIKYEHKNLSFADRRDVEHLLRSVGYRVRAQREDTVAWLPV